MRQADRIIFNTISNYALTFLTMASQIVMVPIVVAHLGKSGFGVANMVLVPYGLFEVLSGSLARALHRLIPQDIASGDPKRVSRTFTTAMAGYVLTGMVGAVSVWLTFDWLLAGADVSAEVMADGRRAMWILVGWLVVGFPTWGYRKGLEAIQRYDLIGISHGVITLARTILVIVVFAWGHGSITFFVGSQLAAIVASSLLCRWTMVRAVPAMTEAPRLIDKTSIRLVGGFAAATMVGMVGEIAGSYGFRILVGKQLGMGSLGALSAILTIQQTMCRLIDELTNAFSPAISALDASGAAGNVAKLMLTGTKSSMLAASAMTVTPLAAASPFLLLWLGESFREYDRLLHMLLLLTLLYCVGLTPMSVLFGLGRVRTTGTVMLIRGVAGLALSAAFVKWGSGSLVGAVACMYGVQYSGGLWMLVSACRAVGVRLRVAGTELIARPLLLSGVAGLATWSFLRLLGENSFWKLAVGVTGGELVLFFLILLFGLGEEERVRIFSFFTRAWGRVCRN